MGCARYSWEDGGEEEEKSNPLTSKSCTTGTSREGGHAATKHRETEITTTEATAEAPPDLCAHTTSGAQGAASGGSCLPETWVQGEAKPGLSGAWNSGLASGKPRPD